MARITKLNRVFNRIELNYSNLTNQISNWLGSKYEKSGIALPDETAISAYAGKIVDDAHIIAKKSGSNVLEILKDTVKDIKNKKNL